MSGPGKMESAKERNGRRGGVGRAFFKLRHALRRRSSNSAVRTAPSESVPEAPNTAPEQVDITEGEALMPAKSPADIPTATMISLTKPLVPDTSDPIEVDETDEPLLPMHVARTGLSNERARKLFERYGIKYEPRNTTKDSNSSTEVHRIEKPIRIRIHWTCHDCNSTFGLSKVCTNCGHRRCSTCSRLPAKRVRQVLEDMRTLKEQEKQEAAASSEEPKSTDTTVVAGTQDVSDAATMSEATQGTEAKQETVEGLERVDVTQYQYVVQHRPRSGVQLVLRPKAQIVRGTCHECQTHFAPANRTKCPKCGHGQCSLCAQHLPKVENETQETSAGELTAANESKLVATVQRVYKKPRQRIRWTCDQCQSTHGDRERCRNCGHERCDACTRHPPKHVPPIPDPAVLRSVEDRLSHLRGQPPYAHQSTVGAIS